MLYEDSFMIYLTSPLHLPRYNQIRCTKDGIIFLSLVTQTRNLQTNENKRKLETRRDILLLITAVTSEDSDWSAHLHSCTREHTKDVGPIVVAKETYNHL